MKGSLRLASKSFSAGTNRTSGPESGLSFLMSGRGCVLALFMLSVQFFGGFNIQTCFKARPSVCQCSPTGSRTSRSRFKIRAFERRRFCCCLGLLQPDVCWLFGAWLEGLPLILLLFSSLSCFLFMCQLRPSSLT